MKMGKIYYTKQNCFETFYVASLRFQWLLKRWFHILIYYPSKSLNPSCFYNDVSISKCSYYEMRAPKQRGEHLKYRADNEASLI